MTNDWSKQLDTVERHYKNLLAIEQRTRQEARNWYVHPDEEDYNDRIADGAESYPKIITQIGRWAITEYGIECLNQSYIIAASALNGTDWIDHMSEKNWVDDLDDFATALYHARSIHHYLGNIK